jgi:uncharacterized protein YifE (UPF0438 family)
VKLSHFPNNPVLESEPPFQCPISFESYLNNPPSSRERKKVWSKYRKKVKRKKMKEIYMLLGKQRKPPDKWFEVIHKSEEKNSESALYKI